MNAFTPATHHANSGEARTEQTAVRGRRLHARLVPGVLEPLQHLVETVLVRISRRKRIPDTVNRIGVPRPSAVSSAPREDGMDRSRQQMDDAGPEPAR